jgi:diaminohydroxyphosphoribosylaminopyrimidine deaminase/5-amino-6-(5-phosphoribosylamino)uracil reductase
MPGAEADDRLMRRALELAARARGLTSPNPMVGAVVARDGAVVGEGVHQRAGAAHAEIVALEAAGDRARGATLYVTLEPCVHQGRTPPCAPRVLAAGLRRVVVACADPNPAVSGRGIAALRQAGVDVTVGVRAVEAEVLNRAFFTAMRDGRPHVTLKGAMTLDGKIADAHGASRWITGEAARQRGHLLRREADAIVVGIGTVLRDDPELTVRLPEPWPREPLRIVLDSTGRTPVDARFIRAATPARAIVAMGTDAPAARGQRLRETGATVMAFPTRDGRIDLARFLAGLHALDVRAVLVEGGAEVHGALVASGLVDRVAVFVAPRLLGGRDAPSLVDGPGRSLKDALGLGPLAVCVLDDDLLIEADVVRAPT